MNKNAIQWMVQEKVPQRVERAAFLKREQLGGGGGDALGVWDVNDVKLGCDDHCTTINVIKIH